MQLMPNSESVQADAPFQITQHQIRMVYAGMMTAVMLAALDGTIVNTALTTIVGELGGFRAYTWVTTSYLLASTAATPLFGKLSDIYGRQRFVKIAVIAFVVGSLLCAMANSMTFLVAARAVQGVGGGGIMAMSYVVIADIVSPRDRGKYVGAFMSVFAVSSVAGPLLGGFCRTVELALDIFNQYTNRNNCANCHRVIAEIAIYFAAHRDRFSRCFLAHLVSGITYSDVFMDIRRIRLGVFCQHNNGCVDVHLVDVVYLD